MILRFMSEQEIGVVEEVIRGFIDLYRRLQKKLPKIKAGQGVRSSRSC